jgi:hypothetical protein
MERNTMNKNTNGDFIFAVLESIVGSAKEYFVSESTVAMVWAECHKNENLITLAGMYLVGSSDRAERNLQKLQDELRLIFIERKVF